MKTWKRIVIHHSASEWGNAQIIDDWHKQRGWSGIGYHFIIGNGYPTYNDYKKLNRFDFMIGQIEYGRTLDGDKFVSDEEIGAHAYGFNSDSIGVCLIHNEKEYHPRMLTSLERLIMELMNIYNIAPENIVGHYELDEKKPHCPSIDMDAFRTHIVRSLFDIKNRGTF